MNGNNTYLTKVFHFGAAHKYGNENGLMKKTEKYLGKMLWHMDITMNYILL